MGAGDISLAIMITAQNQASSVIQGLARDLGPLGVGMAAIGVGAIAAGVAAVKMAGDYQSATTTLVTGAGESVKNLGLVRQGLLDISVATGTSTDALVKSMFLVESAGYHGAQGLQVETIAAEGAKVAHADLTQTADILTTSLHDFNLTAGQATPVMNSLIVTVQNGKMTMDNLNESMKTVLPVAGALHVPLADVEGALSTMAIAGDKGSIAGTHLAMMLKMLANPASTASKEMKAMGIDSIDLANTMRTSLPDALKMIQNAVAQHFVPGSVEYNRAIATILGGSKSGIAGLELMGQNMNTLVTDTNAAANAFKNSGKDVQGWAMVQGDFNQKMDELHATLNVVLIDLGTKMLPILTNVVQNVLIPFVNNLDYIVKNVSPIITFLQGSSVGATLLKDAMIGLGLTIAAVKIATIVNAMGDFVTDVPGMIAKIYLVQTSMTGIGTASTSAATATATSAAAMELSLAGIVTGIGLVLVAEIGLAKWIRDNNIVPVAGNNQPDWVTHLQNRVKSVSDAMQLLRQNIKFVTDATTGATIDLAKFAKTADLSGSSTVTLAQALALVGKNASGFLTASDDAKLLAMNIGNVKDMTNGYVTDLKSAVNKTGAFMSLQDQQMALWFKAIQNGSTQTFSQFQADLQNKAEKELKVTGATADDTLKHLLQLNAPLNTSVDKTAVVAAGQSADITRAKL